MQGLRKYTRCESTRRRRFMGDRWRKEGTQEERTSARSGRTSATQCCKRGRRAQSHFHHPYAHRSHSHLYHSNHLFNVEHKSFSANNKCSCKCDCEQRERENFCRPHRLCPGRCDSKRHCKQRKFNDDVYHWKLEGSGRSSCAHRKQLWQGLWQRVQYERKRFYDDDHGATNEKEAIGPHSRTRSGETGGGEKWLR